jgi:hypothetical protein
VTIEEEGDEREDRRVASHEGDLPDFSKNFTRKGGSDTERATWGMYPRRLDSFDGVLFLYCCRFGPLVE